MSFSQYLASEKDRLGAAQPRLALPLRGSIDSHGWWKPPVTPCCNEMYVILDRSAGIYRKWFGYERDEIPTELHCNRCDKSYFPNAEPIHPETKP